MKLQMITLRLTFALAAIVMMVTNTLQAQTDSNVPMSFSLVTDTGMPTTIVEHGAQWNFGPGALQTYRGWQYAAFWDARRRVSVARRELPTGDWECVSLGGYERTSDGDRGKGGSKSRGFGDGHEKVAMGISDDGVIHLAFDHHCSTLRYRSSVAGVANEPQKFTWNGNLFGAVQDHLGGPQIDYVTYPNFVRDGDRLTLYLRLNGGSGNADSHFFEYRSGRWVINDPASSKLIDKNWSGGNGTVNAYLHTMFVHEGRRHVTWCWRDSPNPSTCHDLCYAFSDDQGETWRNNAGDVVAKRGSKFISADTPGISILKIPPGTSFVNGGSMTVDDRGNIYVLMKGPERLPLFATRSAESGVWRQMAVETTGTLVAFGAKMFVVAESGLYQASIGEKVTLTKIGETLEYVFYDSRFVTDPNRTMHDDTISVVGQNGTRVRVIDFSIGD